jgi:hypothetical protein
MLSSAHILAMDTKNLLDVCDSIRQRFPNITYQLPAQSDSPNVDHMILPQVQQSPKKKLMQQQQQQIPEEFYENVSKMDQQMFLAIQSQNNAPEQIYCNQQNAGIYDNSNIIQQQQLQLEQQLRIEEESLVSPNGSNGTNGTNGVEAQ